MRFQKGKKVEMPGIETPSRALHRVRKELLRMELAIGSGPFDSALLPALQVWSAFAAGIPGTVGGALVMNAGAYGSEMKNVLVDAVLLTKDGAVIRRTGEELELGYRTSNIPTEGLTVLEAEVRLQPGDKTEILRVMNDLAAKRREKQPLEYPSAGSTFKRPEGYFAGKLIDDAGLRGFQVGGAQVSEKHCGFVINRNQATAADVEELCHQVAEKVKEQSGVDLEMEIKRLG